MTAPASTGTVLACTRNSGHGPCGNTPARRLKDMATIAHCKDCRVEGEEYE